MDLHCNRKWLRRLLKAHLEGEVDWREQLPGNRKFLAELQARGISPDLWLAAHPRQFSPQANSQFMLSLCSEPLEILRMGNYFGTCLSIGQINAFSTVANALELNKRVVYARNEAGRVVGRQLLALNANWELVGFEVYSDVADASRKAFEKTFVRYAADFAALCGLALGSDGEVPLLFVEEWYDDGIVPWDPPTGQETAEVPAAG
jgi:hypothetical protein